MNQTNNVTEPIKPILIEPKKPTFKTSYGQTFIALLFVGPAFVLAWLWLGRRVLSPDDAETFKSLLVGLWGLLTAGFGGVTATGGLNNTLTKNGIVKAVALAPAALLGVAAAVPPGSDVPFNDAPKVIPDDMHDVLGDEPENPNVEVIDNAND